MTDLHQSISCRVSDRLSARLLRAALGAAFLIATFLCASPNLSAQSPAPPANEVQVAPVPAAKPPAAPVPDRSTAYYHAALAHTYEDMATNYGRQEYVTRAVEEYKLALNADPESGQLATGLADLYFRVGRIAEAIRTAKDLVQKDDNNLEAIRDQSNTLPA